VDATADAASHASFAFTYNADPQHPVLSSTATDPAGNTSEFSGRSRPSVNHVPGSQTTNENGTLNIGAANTPRWVDDPDRNDSDPLQITLTVGHGTLTLGGRAGLTGSGDGTSSLTYTGSLDALDAALAGLTYTPVSEFDGSDTLTLTVSDLAPRNSAAPASPRPAW
jgi:hypothetical protein